MRSAHLLSIYTRRTFLEWTAFRSFLFTLVVNQAVTPLLGLAVWSAALPGQTGISTYYVALLAVQLMTVSYEYHTVTVGIYEGALNDDLLRPHPVVIGPLGENIAMRIWHLLIGLPIIARCGGGRRRVFRPRRCADSRSGSRPCGLATVPVHLRPRALRALDPAGGRGDRIRNNHDLPSWRRRRPHNVVSRKHPSPWRSTPLPGYARLPRRDSQRQPERSAGARRLRMAGALDSSLRPHNRARVEVRSAQVHGFGRIVR